MTVEELIKLLEQQDPKAKLALLDPVRLETFDIVRVEPWPNHTRGPRVDLVLRSRP